MILLELYFMEPFFFSRLFAVDRVKFSNDFSVVANDPDKVRVTSLCKLEKIFEGLIRRF